MAAIPRASASFAQWRPARLQAEAPFRLRRSPVRPEDATRVAVAPNARRSPLTASSPYELSRLTTESSRVQRRASLVAHIRDRHSTNASNAQSTSSVFIAERRRRRLSESERKDRELTDCCSRVWSECASRRASASAFYSGETAAAVRRATDGGGGEGGDDADDAAANTPPVARRLYTRVRARLDLDRIRVLSSKRALACARAHARNSTSFVMLVGNRQFGAMLAVGAVASSERARVHADCTRGVLQRAVCCAFVFYFALASRRSRHRRRRQHDSRKLLTPTTRLVATGARCCTNVKRRAGARISDRLDVATSAAAAATSAATAAAATSAATAAAATALQRPQAAAATSNESVAPKRRCSFLFCTNLQDDTKTVARCARVY